MLATFSLSLSLSTHLCSLSLFVAGETLRHVANKIIEIL